MKRRFRVTEDCPCEEAGFTQSIGVVKRGAEFETDDIGFLRKFDEGNVLYVAEVPLVQEAPAPVEKKEKGG